MTRSTANAARATCWRWVVLVLLGAVAACSNAPRYSNRPETEAERQARWAAAPWPPQPIRGSNPAEPRENLPYFWPYPDAPALRWPQPHPDAKPERGMSRFEYFNKLCTLEGGEFIYRTVKDVPGYYVIRPRVTSSVAPPGRMGSINLLMNTVYAIEDPFGTHYDLSTTLNSFQSNLASPMQGGYDYIELPRIRWSHVPRWDYYLLGKVPPKDPLVVESRLFLHKPDIDGPRPRDAKSFPRDIMIREGGTGRYARYARQEAAVVDEDWVRMYRKANPKDPEMTWPPKDSYIYHPTVETVVDQLQSEYGVVWRGISRPYDREMGIAGGELIVLHLRTNEILAVLRGFAMVGRSDGEFWWGPPLVCPEVGSTREIVTRTLQPRKPMFTPTANTGSKNK